VAESIHVVKMGHVPHVIWLVIVILRQEKKMSNERTQGIREANAESGSINMSYPIENESDITNQNRSSNFFGPTNDLSEHWLQPTSVQELANQVNSVATKVLNGDIDMGKARTYATLTRVVAQLLAVEVMRSKCLRQPPDLRLGGLHKPSCNCGAGESSDWRLHGDVCAWKKWHTPRG